MPKDILGQDLKRINNIVSSNITTTNLQSVNINTNTLLVDSNVITITNSVATALATGSNIVNATIERVVATGGTITDTLPSASTLVSILNPRVGDSFGFDMRVQNLGSGNYAITGTGYTFETFSSVTTTIKAIQQFKCVFTNVSAGTENIDIYRVSFFSGGSTF
jgi:hypothetical protein